MGNETHTDCRLQMVRFSTRFLCSIKFYFRSKDVCMYSNSLGEIFKRHGFIYHCSADDTLMYMTLKQGDRDMSTWTEKNILKLNLAKTELIDF